MTTTAPALAGLAVSDRPTFYGRGPDVYQQSIDAFRGAGSVRKVWDAHLAPVQRSVREFTERNGFDYKADGYADAMAELPALSETLKQWSRLPAGVPIRPGRPGGRGRATASRPAPDPRPHIWRAWRPQPTKPATSRSTSRTVAANGSPPRTP